jgi:hypothetical protein
MNDHEIFEAAYEAIHGSDLSDEWSHPASSDPKNNGFYSNMSTKILERKLNFHRTSRHKA